MQVAKKFLDVNDRPVVGTIGKAIFIFGLWLKHEKVLIIFVDLAAVTEFSKKTCHLNKQTKFFIWTNQSPTF